MGGTTVETTIENGTDAAVGIRCDALVDTEVAYLTLPHAWRDRLGRLTRLDTVDVQVANQAIVSGAISGPVLLRMKRFRPDLTHVLFIDMDPTHKPYEPLISYTPLEQAQAIVDLVGHRLLRWASSISSDLTSPAVRTSAPHYGTDAPDPDPRIPRPEARLPRVPLPERRASPHEDMPNAVRVAVGAIVGRPVDNRRRARTA